MKYPRPKQYIRIHQEPTELEQMLRSLLEGQHQRHRPPPRPVRRDWNGVVCFSCGKSGSCSNTVPELGRILSVCAARMAGGENTGGGGGGGYYDPTPGWTVGGRKTAKTDPRGGVRLSGQWSCSAPGSKGGGGGAVPTVPHDG